MATDDEYRKQAADAQMMADQVISPVDKESWLRVAQSWLSLIRKPRQTVAQSFDDNVARDGTHQVDSEESH